MAFYTLGCKVNFCETEALQALFEKAGYSVTDFSRPADVYVINTCTVTGLSDHKSRKAIRRARRRAPEAIIVATGCYAQGFPEEVEALEQADLVIGTHGRENLPQIVASLEQDRSPAGWSGLTAPGALLRCSRRRGAAAGRGVFLKYRKDATRDVHTASFPRCGDRCAACLSKRR